MGATKGFCFCKAMLLDVSRSHGGPSDVARAARPAEHVSCRLVCTRKSLIDLELPT